MRRTTLALLAAVVCAGCAEGPGDPAARQLAMTTHQALTAYGKQVGDKVAQETAFYRSQRVNLDHVLFGKALATELHKSAPGEESQGEPGGDGTQDPAVGDIQKTLYYLHIRTKADRESRLAADSLLHLETPKLVTPIIQNVEAGITHEQAVYGDRLRRHLDLANHFLQSLEKLNQQGQALAGMREHLAGLSKEQPPRVRVAEAIWFIRETWNKIEEAAK